MYTSRISLACLISLLVGCAAPARIEQMQVDPSLSTRTALAASPWRGNLAIKDVTGGKETNPLWISNVGSSEFERALENSLRNAGLLAANRQSGQGVLTAHLLKLDQPMFGASFTVTASVQYTLVDRATGKSLWSQTLTTPYTAAFGDALLGAERLKLANEGAIRANIAALIDSLLQVKLTGISVLPITL